MSDKIISYKDLLVWQKSIELVTLVYQLTDTYPKSELFGLTSQMRRAVVSIPSNIAEGKKRNTRKDFRQFLVIASGSGAELETQLIISQKLGYGVVSKINSSFYILDEIQRMLYSIISKL